MNAGGIHDWSAEMWQFLAMAPVGLALAACGVWLLTKRTGVRATRFAGVTLLLLLAFNVAYFFFRRAMAVDAIDMSVNDYVLTLRAVAAVSGFVHAAAVVVMTWAAMSGRRPARDDD